MHPLFSAMWGPWKGGGKGAWGPYGGGGGTVFGLWTGGNGGGGGMDAGEGEGGGSKKNRNRKTYSGEIEGLNEALTEAFESAGITAADEDLEELMKKITNCGKKQSSKFYADERANQKMTAAGAKAFVGEFIEAVMASLSNLFYDKPWFEKVAWNGAALMMVFHTFSNGKIFTRVLKTEIMQFVDDGLLAWSEEDRISRAMWTAIETNLQPSVQKKANGNLTKAYDEAHYNAPFGSSTDASLGSDMAALQDFVKGWMTIFVQKAWNALETGLEDSTEAGRLACVIAIFTYLLNSENACLPLSLQPSLPASGWAYIEQCAQEVLTEQGAQQ